MAVNRGKRLEDFLPDRLELLHLQDKLLKITKSQKNRVWVPFDGPYISMVVPMTEPNNPVGVRASQRLQRFHDSMSSSSDFTMHRVCTLLNATLKASLAHVFDFIFFCRVQHRLQVVVQNMSPFPRDMSFQLHNLPFLHTQYKPCKATIGTIAFGCDLMKIFRLACIVSVLLYDIHCDCEKFRSIGRNERDIRDGCHIPQTWRLQWRDTFHEQGWRGHFCHLPSIFSSHWKHCWWKFPTFPQYLLTAGLRKFEHGSAHSFLGMVLVYTALCLPGDVKFLCGSRARKRT
jgi:hypothetical protein